MWRAIALTFVLFATNAYATPADDAAVLTVVAAKLCSDSPQYGILSTVAERPTFFEGFPKAPHPIADIAHSILERNAAGTLLPVDVDYACLRLTDAKLIDANFDEKLRGDGWERFRKKFSPAKAIIELSLPVYQGDEARLVVAMQCDWLCGLGELWVLKRDGSTWRFVSSDRLWVS